MQVAQSIMGVQKQLQEAEYTLPHLLDHYLDKIEKSRHLNVYLETFEAEARQKAVQLEKKFNENPQQCRRLWGSIMSIKDVLCYKGHKTSASSKILEGFESLYSATAVQRLIDEDAIIIGRTNCDEFAMGSANANSAYGPTLNGMGEQRVPGGSSGGAAVSVQMNTCLAALGSDTGGSVRQPAAFCGVYGFKPSYGRISRYGLIAYGSSFDQIGILSQDIGTTSLILEIIAGKDKMDATSSVKSVENYSDSSPSGKLHIAYFDEVLNHASIAQSVKNATIKKIQQLRQEGHEVKAVSFEYLDYLVPTYYVLTTAEASSNLGRYDGIRYGRRSSNGKDIHDLYTSTRSEGFGMEVKRRIMMGSFVLSVGYYDAYFTKAQKMRKLIKKELEKIFEKFPLILMPTTPDTAWRINEKGDPVEAYLADIFTVIANLSGIPAISLPIGEDKKGMPIGLQLMAPQFEENKLLAAASTLQS